jgi:hypothetical protein
VTHAGLKIDLDAVHSEAGRIGSSEFFQSVKDQVRKEKEESFQPSINSLQTVHLGKIVFS